MPSKKQKQKNRRSAGVSVLETAAPRFSLVDLVERRAPVLVFVLILLASVRIALTYTIFNHTVDEPGHIACGMEWLQSGTYTFETQHPPLGRIAAALGPFLSGARIRDRVVPGTALVQWEGTQILYHNQQYDLTLALARLGILPFFWIACLVVYAWARRYHGAVVGVTALFLFSFSPPILAHSGLATTDMPVAALVCASFYAALVWTEEPTPLRGALFGACSGLAILSKLTAIPFIPACLAGALAGYVAYEKPGWRALLFATRRILPTLALAVLSGALVIWAGYRFSLGKVWFTRVPLPAPELFSGIQDAFEHNRFGHHTYLLGQYSVNGFWYYYPVVLAVKTPLALLALFGAGLVFALRQSGRPLRVWPPLGLTAGVLAVGLYSRVNIGVRHILPIYAGISVLAAIAAARLPQELPNRWGKAVVAVLFVWLGVSSLVAHPDYLPYFNELAGDKPERIVVDSDLDWGQDIKRLARRLEQVGAERVAFSTILLASLQQEHGFPPLTRQDPFQPSPGWNAVSMTSWKLERLGLLKITPDGKLSNQFPGRTLWPDRVPPGERIGRSILLWNVGVRPAPGPSDATPRLRANEQN